MIKSLRIFQNAACCSITLLLVLSGCTEENHPPTANLEITPTSGEVPLDVNIKLTGEDLDGFEDIIQYKLTIGTEVIKSETPIDITRTFQTAGTINIHGEVMDSDNQVDQTEVLTITPANGPYIDQSLILVNDVEISYFATLYMVNDAELKINKDGNLFMTIPIHDTNPGGTDFQKIFKNNPDGITKGNYEFILKAGELEKKNSVLIQNFKPTINLIGIKTLLIIGTEITVVLPSPDDKNPEDNPVNVYSAKSFDGKTQVTLNGSSLVIKAVGDNIGSYQVELEFGSAAGNIEKVMLSGTIIPDLRWQINPFKQPNDSTLNWYGSGDVNNDNVLNSQDLTRITEIINGTYNNPADTRLLDRADVTGDALVNSQDRQVLESRLNGTLGYLPGEWNKLRTRPERESWLSRMFAVDKTDEREYILGQWVCHHFAKQVVINFNGSGPEENDEQFDLKDNGRFNIPVCYVSIQADAYLGHAINAVMTGDNIENFQDWAFIESQSDNNVIPGMYDMPATSTLYIMALFNPNSLTMRDILIFKIDDTVPTFFWKETVEDVNLVSYRP